MNFIINGNGDYSTTNLIGLGCSSEILFFSSVVAIPTLGRINYACQKQ